MDVIIFAIEQSVFCCQDYIHRLPQIEKAASYTIYILL